mmetsp:Transcript_8/g.50  ORF Transcript_8/g.50 Transcript_8/m.50 type:complete len:292 (-) Transcript_8:342-1217(-)
MRRARRQKRGGRRRMTLSLYTYHVHFREPIYQSRRSIGLRFVAPHSAHVGGPQQRRVRLDPHLPVRPVHVQRVARADQPPHLHRSARQVPPQPARAHVLRRAAHGDQAARGPLVRRVRHDRHARPRGYHERHRVSPDEHDVRVAKLVRGAHARHRLVEPPAERPDGEYPVLHEPTLPGDHPAEAVPRPLRHPPRGVYHVRHRLVQVRAVLVRAQVHASSARLAVVRQHLGPDRVQVADDDVGDEGGADRVGVVVREQSRHVVEQPVGAAVGAVPPLAPVPQVRRDARELVV